MKGRKVKETRKQEETKKRENRWKEDEQKEEMKRKRSHFRRDHVAKDIKKMKQKKTWFKKEGSKTGKNNLFCKFLLRRSKQQEERETTKEHYSLWRTNKQETVSFEKKRQHKRNNSKTHCFFCEEGRVRRGEKTIIKPNRETHQKRSIKRNQLRKTFKNENKKEKCLKTQKIKTKEGKIEKKKGQICKNKHS